jgi:transposase-like protein
MLSIKSLIESLGVFERNKVPFELKVLGLAFHIQLSSLRRVARALSEVHRVSKTAIWKWVGKLSERICVDPPKMPRRLVALDKTCVKVNGLEYRVYAAIDVSTQPNMMSLPQPRVGLARQRQCHPPPWACLNHTLMLLQLSFSQVG